jgi:hypothetical protein
LHARFDMPRVHPQHFLELYFCLAVLAVAAKLKSFLVDFVLVHEDRTATLPGT